MRLMGAMVITASPLADQPSLARIGEEIVTRPLPRAAGSIDNEQLGPGPGRGAMRRIAVIGDLVAHAGHELDLAPVSQLRLELALDHEQDVAAITPVIGEIAGRVIDAAHPDIADLERAPCCHPGRAGMLGHGDRAPIGGREGKRRDLQSCFSSSAAPETSALPGVSSMFSDFTTPSSTSIE